MKNSKAFTLIEIMIAMAIVGILAAVTLVSLKSFGGKARSSKAQAQLSSAIPSMVSCWGNGYSVRGPSSNKICRDASVMPPVDKDSYGTWPSLSGDLSTYSYGISDVSTPPPASGWYFSASSGATDDNIGICCNKTMGGCKIIALPVNNGTCNGSTPAN